MTTESTAIARIVRNAVETLPDSGRYKCRFKIRSASTNQLYLVSFDTAPGMVCWVCSCRGCIAHGQCKHLTAMGLRGRASGRNSLENRDYLKQIGG